MDVDLTIPVPLWITTMLISGGLLLIASGLYMRELGLARLKWWSSLLCTLPMLGAAIWCIKVCMNAWSWYTLYRLLTIPLSAMVGGSPQF